MRGDRTPPARGAGKTALTSCKRCGGRHRGACDLVPLYRERAGIPPAWARRSIADRLDD